MKAIMTGAALAVLTLVQPLQAQDQPRQIEVTGEARIEAAPDMAVITLGVREQAPEAAAAMRAVSRAMVAVVDELRAGGVAAEDMQTRDISLSPVWSQRGGSDGPRDITGFAASNTLTIRLRDLEQLGPVLDQVLAAGANEFRGLRFEVSNPDVLQDTLRGPAVDDAFRKARQLAEASGMRLDAPRVIRDAGSRDGGPGPVMMEMARSGAMPVEPGSLSLSHSVTVIFGMSKAAE